ASNPRIRGGHEWAILQQVVQTRCSLRSPLRMPRRQRFMPRDDKAELFDHLIIGFGRLTLGGEIVADEDRIGGIEAESLQAPQMPLAAASDAQLALRIHEAKHG